VGGRLYVVYRSFYQGFVLRDALEARYSRESRRGEMAEPVYKFWRTQVTEAWFQLSEEEQNAHLAKIGEALEKVGGKSIVTCASAWSAEQWLACGVEEFPDIDAVQQHTRLLFELEHSRYMSGESWLGTKWPLE
jgi:hypothetical protein